MPLGERHLHAAGYLRRLMQRPSFARVVEEAEPYFKMFPAGNAQQAAAARPTQASDPFVGLILRGGSEGGRQMSYIDVAIPAVAGLLAWARPEMFLRKPPDMRKLRLVRLFGILLLIVSAVYLAVRLAGL
jgi:hypothetical protein